MSDDGELPLEGVREVLAELGRPVDGLTAARVPGGASREAWLLQAGGGSLFLRRDPPGGTESLLSQAGEYEVVGAARAAGVPVPEPLHHEPMGGRFGSAGVLYGFVEGESIGRRIIRKPEFKGAREVLPAQIAAALARIHAIPVDRLEGALGPAPRNPLEVALDAWERALDSVTWQALPAVELGLRWLRLNRPGPVEPALVHGDFRLGNFIVSPEDGLRAVIDWELCHPGDPAEDIGWLCIRSWRFGADGSRVGGVGDLHSFLAAYAEAGGAEITPQRVLWWEVFGNVKWAVICAQQAGRHLSGREPSLELASLGRRICEPEWDLLELVRQAA
jgi:aminoglycoside phosphotransferase (APT) family kinase protein